MFGFGARVCAAAADAARPARNDRRVKIVVPVADFNPASLSIIGYRFRAADHCDRLGPRFCDTGPKHCQFSAAQLIKNPRGMLVHRRGCGGIGRRTGFRFQRPNGRVGSSPIIPTTNKKFPIRKGHPSPGGLFIVAVASWCGAVQGTRRNEGAAPVGGGTQSEGPPCRTAGQPLHGRAEIILQLRCSPDIEPVRVGTVPNGVGSNTGPLESRGPLPQRRRCEETPSRTDQCVEL